MVVIAGEEALIVNLADIHQNAMLMILQSEKYKLGEIVENHNKNDHLET